MLTIGFVGLGHMGNPMANNLLKAGFKVKVYDLVPAAVEALQIKGAVVAKNFKELAEDSDVLITMLQTGHQVQSACLEATGLFTYFPKGNLYIDCSSIDIKSTKKLHAEAEKQGISMVDAPVSGGVAGAEAAALTFMVGGKAQNFEKAKSILSCLGKKIIHAGPEGTGQAAKICNNLILAISMVGVSEAFNLAKKLGLDPKQFFEISSNASGQCWAMTSYCPEPGVIEKAPSNQNYEPGFMAKMMLKDLRLAANAAEEASSAIPLGAATAELYALFVNQGNGEKDFSGIIKMLAGE